ncbi:MAG: RsmB/NOP family class I SAM-dependent RNA methyltransferase [Desulfobacteraceae bacterium]|nr:RsmB/NOP family class I SAM-dependent RNA methyltransferase [Desulfobacteraceae bacterium]
MTTLFDRYREIIPEFSSFQESLRQPLPVHFRVNRLKIEPQRLVETLKGKGISLQRVSDKYDTLFSAPHLVGPGKLLEYFLGYVHTQALTSCLACIALCPGPGSYILDMCASPGGKTSHLAQLTENTGLIIANEPYPNRHVILSHTLNRMGVLNTVATAYRAELFPLRQRFDYILADVPCSGEGTFRMKHKHSRYRERKGRARLPELQKKILLRAFDLLKESGQLIYSTCTYNPEENESVVDFLLRNRDAALHPMDLDVEHEPGLCEWGETEYGRALHRAARFYPHQLNSVGFFMARIGRRG